MKRLFAIGLSTYLACAQLHAEARQLRPELSTTALEKAGLSLPISASFLYFPQEQRDLKEQHCPAQGFYLDSNKSASHEKLSHSLKISSKNGVPVISECLRENSCYELHGEIISKKSDKKSTKILLKGRAADYAIVVNTSLTLPSKDQKCTSFALEIMKSQKLEIKVPVSLWLLNYGHKIVLLDGSNEKTWFTVNLPKGLQLATVHKSAIDTNGNILISDSINTIFLSPKSDEALIKSSKGFYNTAWGLGSAGYSDEWDYAPISSFEQVFNTNNPQRAFTLLSGIIAGKTLISWNEISKLMRGNKHESRSLPGMVVTANEELGLNENTIYLATEETAQTMTLSRMGEFQLTPTILKEGLKFDPRARQQDFILLEKDLYRFTADGLYRSTAQGEIPTILQGFKGFMKNDIQLLTGKVYSGKQCSLKIWSNRSSFFGLLSPQIKDISCKQGEGLGTSPWSFSATGITPDRLIRSVVTTTD